VQCKAKLDSKEFQKTQLYSRGIWPETKLPVVFFKGSFLGGVFGRETKLFNSTLSQNWNWDKGFPYPNFELPKFFSRKKKGRFFDRYQ